MGGCEMKWLVHTEKLAAFKWKRVCTVDMGRHCWKQQADAHAGPHLRAHVVSCAPAWARPRFCSGGSVGVAAVSRLFPVFVTFPMENVYHLKLEAGGKTRYLQMDAYLCGRWRTRGCVGSCTSVP